MMNEAKTNEPLRILHIILALRPTNGQYNEHCLPLRHSREITICSYFKSEIVPPKEITLYDGDNSVRGFVRVSRAALEEREYDVIHVHTPHAGVLLLLTLFLSGLYKKLRPSTVHTIQNSYQSFKLRNKLLFIPSFVFFQHLVFCSYASYRSFPSFLKWLGGNRMRVVQNAVDLDRIDRALKRTHFSRNQRFAIVTVGLIDIKNPFTVLAAFHQSHDESSELIFLGDGYLRTLLTGKIVNLRLEKRVTLTGMIERDGVFGHYARADLFLSASRGEGLPVAVLEAMACCCPVVLSDIPPHREIAEGCDFIPLIQPDDVEGFVREIRKFREMSAEARRAIGRKCRQVVEERFSLPAMHAGYAEIYSQTAGRPITVHLNQAS